VGCYHLRRSIQENQISYKGDISRMIWATFLTGWLFGFGIGISLSVIVLWICARDYR
jgi:hypothetical protein